jgi:hypothetical protein
MYDAHDNLIDFVILDANDHFYIYAIPIQLVISAGATYEDASRFISSREYRKYF